MFTFKTHEPTQMDSNFKLFNDILQRRIINKGENEKYRKRESKKLSISIRDVEGEA